MITEFDPVRFTSLPSNSWRGIQLILRFEGRNLVHVIPQDHRSRNSKLLPQERLVDPARSTLKIPHDLPNPARPILSITKINYDYNPITRKHSLTKHNPITMIEKI